MKPLTIPTDPCGCSSVDRVLASEAYGHKGFQRNFEYWSVFRSAAVAQWIEYWPPKPRVVGSIPASRTTRGETANSGLQ